MCFYKVKLIPKNVLYGVIHKTLLVVGILQNESKALGSNSFCFLK